MEWDQEQPELQTFRGALREHVRERKLVDEKGKLIDGHRIEKLLHAGDGLLSRSGVDYLGYARAYYTSMSVGGLLAVVVAAWLIGKSRTVVTPPGHAYSKSEWRLFPGSLGVFLGGIGSISFLLHAAGCFHVWISPTTFVLGKFATVLVPLLEKFL